ncbi:MAG TPA: FHA domain-containing protein [Gammaproteobacteria bacterium]
MIFKRTAPDTSELSLKVGGKTYLFNDPSELEFALSGRICVPSAKITALVDVRDEDLLDEAAAIKQAERRFADALSGVLADIGGINNVLKEVDLALISQDNEWRAIIASLMAVPAGFEQYKKIALVKYMQYLVSRQEIVKGLYEHRQIHKPSSRESATRNVGEESLKETAIFEMTTFAAPTKEGAEFSRLPKGETLEVELEPNTTFSLRLAKSVCGIVHRGRLIFLDDKGQETSLREGKNIIGRDAGADIIMDPNLRDVSRKHLIVESDGSKIVRVTDISSHGTWVDPKYLDSTGI